MNQEQAQMTVALLEGIFVVLLASLWGAGPLITLGVTAVAILNYLGARYRD